MEARPFALRLLMKVKAMPRYDLNDARVEALRIATDGGLTLADFNKIWVLLVQRPWEKETR